MSTKEPFTHLQVRKALQHITNVYHTARLTCPLTTWRRMFNCAFSRIFMLIIVSDILLSLFTVAKIIIFLQQTKKLLLF